MKPISVPTIPLNDAIIRVTRFRDELVKQVPEMNIPRAILIPIYDLMAIVEKYTSVDDNGNITYSIEGVRAYFDIKITDELLPNDITALVVPVDLKGNDIITNSITGLGNPGDDSEIYDFTKPCPDQCDPESPLYVP
ncbi:hypothetical protein GM921_02265 [Pedobacter sp. LMG 31464]|uniref:Uncharacterized protein n=1 Tax=Pedobacter planticolens TaxID=2679964 RepID=A0A923IUL9_9SPHI|nr:hypothetical protein [Pedobacter planticolens]MBB2144299.1 hypothetical protein [Pedobacter planticolens]